MTDKILLTGASGFVGRHVLQTLSSQPADIHTVGRRPIPQSAPRHCHHLLDLTDPGATNAALEQIQPTHLLHLAWDVTHGAFWSSPANLDWVAASLNLYRAFARQGGRRIAVSGSFAEYDWSFPHLDEAASACVPATLYGQSKHALHGLLAAAARQDGISLAWPRLFMLYGPQENPARFVSSIARALVAGRPAVVRDGGAVRDFLHVADAARALATVLLSAHEGAVNIASGCATSLAEVAEQIAQLTLNPHLLTVSPGTHSTLTASTALLAGLGFKPHYALSEGLAEVVEALAPLAPREAE